MCQWYDYDQEAQDDDDDHYDDDDDEALKILKAGQV